jgi:hypothetical protein
MFGVFPGMKTKPLIFQQNSGRTGAKKIYQKGQAPGAPK